MLYLIGLGLNEKGISIEGLEAVGKCNKIYLEGYTVDFPYAIESLEKTIGKKIERLERASVESDKLIKEAAKKNIALLIYGCPLFATTHLSLLMEAKKAKIKTRVIYAASVFDAVAECGLELYKFGKITSMPAWQGEKFRPESFMDIVKENQSIRAHSLILIDIGLGIEDSLHQLKIAAKNKNIKLEKQKIVICSQLGTKEAKFYYDTIEKLNVMFADETKELELPYCIILPSTELHFLEKEALERL